MAKENVKVPVGPYSCRRREKRSISSNPFPLKFYKVQYTEDGTRKLVEGDCVSPSLASDFDILNVGLYGHGSSQQYRVETDPLDFEERVAQVIND